MMRLSRLARRDGARDFAHHIGCEPADLRKHVTYLPAIRAIYFRVQKAANSTIVAALERAETRGEAGNPSPKKATSRRLEDDPSGLVRALDDPAFFKFSFVRSPYARIASCFLDKIQPREGRAPSRPKYRTKANLPETGQVSLFDFLSRIRHHDPRQMDRHWRPQSLLIPEGRWIDFVGRVESFDADFAEVHRRLGIPFNGVQRAGRHDTDANRWLQDLIGPQEKVLIDEIYAQDFARFGYDTVVPGAELPDPSPTA